ncbi:isocitrate dehydrogenase V [Striga asiatica]|uniref:Isocitrate dehydrogenase V n=1 Tax=Striga asiatica TaxID=4170 RepID=A0A5A7PZM3_STRAF|nr:isocitrate dehydrogenase V [Striga asiatica]
MKAGNRRKKAGKKGWRMKADNRRKKAGKKGYPSITARFQATDAVPVPAGGGGLTSKGWHPCAGAAAFAAAAGGGGGFVSQHFPVEIAALKPHAALTIFWFGLVNFEKGARDEFVDVVSTFTFVGAVRALHVLPQESPTSLKEPLGIVYSKKSSESNIEGLNAKSQENVRITKQLAGESGAEDEFSRSSSWSKTSLWTKIPSGKLLRYVELTVKDEQKSGLMETQAAEPEVVREIDVHFAHSVDSKTQGELWVGGRRPPATEGNDEAALIHKHREAGQSWLERPTATLIGKGHRSLNLTFRKELHLYANVRPCYSLPGYKTKYDVDLLAVRENTEGEYNGLEHQTADKSEGCRVFHYAKTHGRERVSAIHKANIMQKTDCLFLKLVKIPSLFDVFVMPILYGGIMNNLCAGLIGALTLVREVIALVEAVHGSGPDIAAKTSIQLSLAFIERAEKFANSPNVWLGDNCNTVPRLSIDSVVASMDAIDMVFVGSVGVLESGCIINMMGTYQTALVANSVNKPVYQFNQQR